MTIETEDVVAELRQIAELILDGVTLGAGTLGVGRANAARAAADLIQSLSDRIAVQRALLKRVTDAAENLAGELHDPGTEALAAIHCARASLIKEGSDAS